MEVPTHVPYRESTAQMAILQRDSRFASAFEAPGGWMEGVETNGATSGANGSGGTMISADEFQALEGKVLQAVEMIRRERDARAVVEAERNAAQAEVTALQERLASLEEANSTVKTELEGFHRERDAVRGRVERMLAQMDELL